MRARLLAELGEVRGRRGDDAGARKRFAEALAAQPGFPPAVVGLVRLDEERGDLPAVIAAWEDLVARFPARGEFHARLADALRRRAEGEPARAPAALRRAAELVLEATRPAPGAPPDPERLTPPGRNAFGMILLRQGAFEAALEQFRKAAAADPAYLRPRTNLGVLHLNLAGQARAALASGRVPAAERPAVEARAAAHREEALRRLGEVLAAAPAHAKALYNRAEVLWHLEPRDPAGARRDLEAALAAEPGYRRARDLLAEVLRQDAPVAAPR
jgi:Tfp pilus assembly protein PilF